MAANSSSPSAGGGDVASPSVPPVRLSAAQAATIQPSSPRYFFSSLAGGNASSHRRIAIAVDLSDESAFAVRWAVQNYLRPGDAVVLLHVRPTSVLYGADWGSIPVSVSDDDGSADGEDAPAAAAEGAEAASAEELQKKREEDFDTFTSIKSQDLAQPLVAAQIPFKIHVVKDHDMKERLCLEAERLGLSAMIMEAVASVPRARAGKGDSGVLVIIVCITVSARLWLFATRMMLQVSLGRQQEQQMSCTLCLRTSQCIMMHLTLTKKTEAMTCNCSARRT